MVGRSRKSKQKAGCTEGAWMTLQLRQKFMASQAVMGLMKSHLQIFRARSIISAFVIPMLILLFREGWSDQLYSFNLGSSMVIS